MLIHPPISEQPYHELPLDLQAEREEQAAIDFADSVMKDGRLIDEVLAEYVHDERTPDSIKVRYYKALEDTAIGDPNAFNDLIYEAAREAFKCDPEMFRPIASSAPEFGAAITKKLNATQADIINRRAIERMNAIANPRLYRSISTEPRQAKIYPSPGRRHFHAMATPNPHGLWARIQRWLMT